MTYSPDHEFLNKLFRDTWNPQNIRFRGFIHSHPGRMSRPSYGDEIYAERILRAIDDLEFLWLPIVSTVPNTGVFKLTPWAAFRAKKGVSVVRGKVEILRAPAKSTFSINGVQVLQALKTGEPMDEILVGKEKPDLVSRIAGKPKDEETSVVETANDTPGEQPEWKHETATSVNVRNTFDRVRDAYDLDLMHNSRIIAVHVWSYARHATKQHLKISQGKSVIHGHTHRADASIVQNIWSPGRVLQARSAGCLCKPIPLYGTGRPVEWVNAFILGYLGRRSDTLYTIPIMDHRCILPDGTEVAA